MSLTFSSTAGFIGIVTTSPKTLQLPAISARNGRVITFKDKTGLAALNPITLLVTGADRFETGSSTYVINQNYGTVTIVGHLAAAGDGGINTWNIIQAPTTTYMNANFSTATLSSLSLWDRGGLTGLAGTASTIQSSGTLTMSTGSLLVNGSTIAFTGQLQSTVLGLNTYINSFIDPTELTSTVVGLGTANYVSTFGLTFSLTSTVVGLGTSGYVSSFQLLSTTVGVYGAISSNIANTVGPQFQSTVVNLGMVGYVSTSQLTSTVIGLGTAGYVSTSQLTSTVIGLGTAGYVSSSQLTSTITGIGASFSHSNLFIPLGGVPVTSTNQWFTALFSTTSQGIFFGGSPTATSTVGSFAGIAPLSNVYSNPISSYQIYIADETTTLQRLSTYNTLTIEQAGATALAFYYTGANQSYTVPAGIYSIYVQMSGAGGGPGSSGGTGGKGGLTYGYLAVTPGQVLTLLIGQGGSTSTGGGTVGGGGNGSTANSYTGGQGGGRTAIIISGADYVVAGGGGGAGSASGTQTNGGDGGGLTGGTGTNGGGTAGTGGTQTNGGTGFNAGTNGVGGNGNGNQTGGGGGGGGYYGGGGASGGNSTNKGGAGGGGSGFIANLTSGTTIQGGGVASGANGYIVIQTGPIRSGNYLEVRDGVSKFLLDRNMNVGINVTAANNPQFALQVGGSTLMSSLTTGTIDLVDRMTNALNHLITSNGSLYYNGSAITTGAVSALTGSGPITTSGSGTVTVGFADTYLASLTTATGLGALTISANANTAYGGSNLVIAGPNLQNYVSTANLANLVSTANLTNLVSTANLAFLVSTANLTNLVSTANLTNLVSTANLAFLVSTANLTNLVSTANLTNMVSTSLLSTFGQNLGYYYGYLSSLSNVSSISTTLAVTSSFSGNLADAMTLILFDL
jgi:Glycine rich protein